MRTTNSSAQPADSGAGGATRPGATATGEERGRGARPAGPEQRRASRGERIPRNVFFVRMEGRVAALLVGRAGQLRVQGSAEEPWRLYQVGSVRSRWPRWRLRLHLTEPPSSPPSRQADRPTAAGGGEATGGRGAAWLTVDVYGSGEAGRLDLGHDGIRPRSVPLWRRGRLRNRRLAAARLRAQIES